MRRSRARPKRAPRRCRTRRRPSRRRQRREAVIASSPHVTIDTPRLARQHRSQRRPHRQSVAGAISRRGRSEFAADRAVLAVGRAGCLLRGIRLGAGGRHDRGPARPRYGMETERLGHAWRRSSGDADLRQRPGPRLHPHHRGRRPLSVHRQGSGGEQRRRAGHAVSLRADLAPRHADGARLLHSARGPDRRDGRGRRKGRELQEDRRLKERELGRHRRLARLHRQILGGGAAARRPTPR